MTTSSRDFTVDQAIEHETVARDWFLSAIACDGPVGQCLDVVIAELAGRSSFMAALKQNLTFPGQAVDTVSDLAQKIRALENTLRFRLPMLLPERPAAWFRPPAATTTGPFQATLLGEPVFGNYEITIVDDVEKALTTAWSERRIPSLPFNNTSGCLWRTLLVHNARLEEICALPAPFADFRLDVLPDGLPMEIGSRALRAFLINVRSEILLNRERYEQ